MVSSVYIFALLSGCTSGPAAMRDAQPAPTVASAAAAGCETSAWINTEVARIATMKDEADRVRYADTFSNKVSRLTESELDGVRPETIDVVALLLEDENELIRSMSMDVLGTFGYRAERAIPALERASKIPDKPLPPGGYVLGASLSDLMLGTIEYIRDDIRERRKRP
jgi:hypothetical protein